MCTTGLCIGFPAIPYLYGNDIKVKGYNKITLEYPIYVLPVEQEIIILTAQQQTTTLSGNLSYFLQLLCGIFYKPVHQHFPLKWKSKTYIKVSAQSSFIKAYAEKLK